MTQNTSSGKSHASVLNTVPEERQGSRDSDPAGSKDRSPTESPPIIKYKCTELDEFNRLDDDNDRRSPNSEKRREVNNVTEYAQNEKLTLFEQGIYSSDRVAKRSSLKR